MLKRIWPEGKGSLYNSAIALFNQGQYRQAIGIFKKIIAGSISRGGLTFRLASFYCAQAYYNLGRILFAMGNYLGALQEFEEVLYIDPERSDVYEYMGRCYEKIGAQHNTLDIYHRIAQLNPFHCPAELKVVSAFHRLGIWDRIEAACLRRIKLHPRHADLYYALGLTYLGLGRPVRAISAFDQAVAINPEYWPARIRLGATYASAEEFGKADAQFSMILGKFPDYVDLYHHIGVIHAGRKDDPVAALKWFQMALSRNPNFTGARIKLAVLLAATGQYEEAIRTLREGARLNPDNGAFPLLLEYLEKESTLSSLEVLEHVPDQGLLTQTIGTYGKNLAIAPNVSEMLMLTRPVEDDDLPRLLEEVIEVVQHADHLYDRYPDFKCNIGVLFYRAGRLEDAETAFRQAVALNPAYTGARLMLFNTLKTAGKTQSAMEAGAFLLDQQVAYPDFLLSLGELYLETKAMEKAEALFQKTIDLSPDYEKARIYLKKMLEKKKNL